MVSMKKDAHPGNHHVFDQGQNLERLLESSEMAKGKIKLTVN